MGHGIAYKETYRGQGIYWHFAAGMYGDETKPLYRTISEYRRAIDAHITQTDDSRPEYQKHWDRVPHSERVKWRRLCLDSDLSAPEMAYQHHLHSGGR